MNNLSIEDRIQSYLGNGGLFNPEQMDHCQVRDLLIDIRIELLTLRTNLSQIEAVVARRPALNSEETLLAKIEKAILVAKQVDQLRAKVSELEKDKDTVCKLRVFTPREPPTAITLECGIKILNLLHKELYP